MYFVTFVVKFENFNTKGSKDNTKDTREIDSTHSITRH